MAGGGSMKALSIRQPWAYAILNLGKTIENRSRGTSYRGALAIHASQKYDVEVECFLFGRGFCLPPREAMPTGGIVGTVMLRGVIAESEIHLMPPSDRKWFFGPVGYVLDSPIPCEFAPLRGRLGFFDVPDKLVRVAE